MVTKLDIQKCFEILELDPQATLEDAKKAHRDLVSIWHPDRVPSQNPRLQKKATQRLKEINAAYDMVLPYLYAHQVKKPQPAIDTIISEARNRLKSREYLKSKNSYESALNLIGDSQFKKDRLFLARKQKIEEELLSRDIFYGSQGFIKYGNKWIAPDEYQKHYVTYKGGVRHYKELKNIITQITDPHIRIYLIEKYSDQTIHKKQVECYKLALNQKNKSSSHFRVFYRWEVWTFDIIEEGVLSIDMIYNSETDRWQFGRIYEKTPIS